MASLALAPSIRAALSQAVATAASTPAPSCSPRPTPKHGCSLVISIRTAESSKYPSSEPSENVVQPMSGTSSFESTPFTRASTSNRMLANRMPTECFPRGSFSLTRSAISCPATNPSWTSSLLAVAARR